MTDAFLTTDRLVLRRFTMADEDNLVELDGDPDVMHYIPGDESGDVEYAVTRAEWLLRCVELDSSAFAIVSRPPLAPGTRRTMMTLDMRTDREGCGAG